MATKKTAGKPVAKRPVKKPSHEDTKARRAFTKKPTEKPVKKMVGKPMERSVERSAEKPVPAAPAERRPPPVSRPQGPTARTCPLVLDGEVDAAAFTPDACLSCDEFDCRFCEAAEGSGALRSRLFAAEEGEEGDEEDGWGFDADFGAGGGEEPADGDGDDESLD
jgi:hypothetical protein